MHIAGVIAEYDPFHNGHKAHLEATRAAGATHIVIVLGGPFTQRGEPSLLPKGPRVQAALAAGADLVLELPIPWSMAPAEIFANGGVAVLKGLGCVDTLSFGSEAGNAQALEMIANAVNEGAYSTALRQALNTGIPYAAARQTAATALLGEPIGSLLGEPNNTLGIEYIRAIHRQKASISIFTCPRQGTMHNSDQAEAQWASASLLRQRFMQNGVDAIRPFVPSSTADILQEAAAEDNLLRDHSKLHTMLLGRLRLMERSDFGALPYISEGLENRLYCAVRSAENYDALLAAAKTRRYPLARLRRILWAALLQISSEMPLTLPPYIRILGLNRRGIEILAAARPSLPLVSRTVQIKALSPHAQTVFATECRAADLYALALETPRPCGTEQSRAIIHR